MAAWIQRDCEFHQFHRALPANASSVNSPGRGF
jgi:hypothetical protein